MTGYWLEIGQELLGRWWLPQVFVVLGATLAVSFLLRWFLKFLQRNARRTSNVLDDAVLSSAYRPSQVLIWLIGLALIAQLLLGESHYASWLSKIQEAGILLALGWFLLSLISEYSDRIYLRTRQRDEELDEDIYIAISRVLRATVVVIVGVGLLHTFNVSIMGLLTFGGVGGLVVGFAAKDMLENFFGGLMLHMDRPFKTGDWIRSPDRNIEGTVEKIGWRQTCIRTHSRNALYIPNGMFLTIVIENPGRMSHRMIKEIIGLRYSDLNKMKTILKDVQDMLANSDQVDQSLPVLTRFDTFNESSVDFFVQCYTRNVGRARYTEIKQDVLFAIADIVERHGAEIAFPTRTVFVQQQSS